MIAPANRRSPASSAMPSGSTEARAYVIASPRRYGFINVEGNIVIGAKYRWAAHFSEGRALVYAGKYAGFVDPLGAEIIPPQFSAGYTFSERVAAVQTGGK